MCSYDLVTKNRRRFPILPDERKMGHVDNSICEIDESSGSCKAPLRRLVLRKPAAAKLLKVLTTSTLQKRNAIYFSFFLCQIRSITLLCHLFLFFFSFFGSVGGVP